MSCLFFFFNDTATTEIYTLSLHDALPISERILLGHALRALRLLLDLLGIRRLVAHGAGDGGRGAPDRVRDGLAGADEDRKSTRLNSSHANISYAVFCLKKKKKNNTSLHTL